MALPTKVQVRTVTVSDSRTPETDESGSCLRYALQGAGFGLAGHRIVPDEVGAIRAALDANDETEPVDAIVLTGGTGIAPRDCTIEAIEPLLDKRLEGFGEAFRRLSWEQIGPRSVLSRAMAGVRAGRLVVALPGSPRAVELAVERLIVPILGHAVELLRGHTNHRAEGEPHSP